MRRAYRAQTGQRAFALYCLSGIGGISCRAKLNYNLYFNYFMTQSQIFSLKKRLPYQCRKDVVNYSSCSSSSGSTMSGMIAVYGTSSTR